MTLQLAIIALALAGFGIAAYITIKKRRPQPLVCPIGSHCDNVVKSEFSKFLGIPVELLGLLYYAGIAISYTYLLVAGQTAAPWFLFAVLATSFVALLFSAYLTFIQIAVLKQLCTWCIFSAIICTAIFFTAMTGNLGSIIAFIATHRPLLLFGHIAAVAVGVGAATVGDTLFFRFLKDQRIQAFEADVLKGISQVIWVTLGLATATGIGLALPHLGVLSESAKFLAKMTVLGVLIINGLALNHIIQPHLVHMSFSDKRKGAISHGYTRLAYTLGAISLTSWYSMLLLGTLPRSFVWTYNEIIAVYAGVLLVAGITAQLIERLVTKRDITP